MKFSWKVLICSLLSASLILLTVGVASAGTPVVTPGADPSAVILGGVRYRELATGPDQEVFLGIPDLGDAGRRTQTDLTWGANNTFTLTYDPVLDKLTTTVNNGSTGWTLEYLNYSDQVGDLVYGGSQALANEALGKLNYIGISIRLQEKSPAQVNLNNVFLDTYSLGNFVGINQDTASWQVNGYDLSAGFTLTGVLALSNVTKTVADFNYVEIVLGNVNNDTFAPAISSVQAAPNPQTGGEDVTLTAVVDDTGSGGSIIESADYQLDAGAWTPMAAADGSFNSATENVTVTLPAPLADGEHNLCVRGTDSANNTSTEECTTLLVDSQAPTVSAVAVDPTKTGGGSSVNLTATVDDSTSGGSNIQSAEYSTNGIDWDPMSAQDGSFNTPTEVVTATLLSAATSGEVDVCVRGSDAAGNTSTESCTTLTVDSDGPLTSALVFEPNPADSNAQVALSATVDDTTTGDSIVSSAEYQVAGGAWLPMQAVDGDFDSVTEAVKAQFTAPVSAGPVEVCVRGTDAFGNAGAAACDLLGINPAAGPQPVYLPLVVFNSSAP